MRNCAEQANAPGLQEDYEVHAVRLSCSQFSTSEKERDRKSQKKAQASPVERGSPGPDNFHAKPSATGKHV
jgi:hypothetical protein